MILTEAVDAIYAAYPAAEGEAVLRLHTDDCIEITSGGPRTDRDVEPALYASRDLAVAAWHHEVMAALTGRAPTAIKFVDGPHLDKWNITVMDSRGTHRVSEPRWSVTAKIGLIVTSPTEGTAE